MKGLMFRLFVVLVAAGSTIGTAGGAASARYPFPQHLSYAAGTLRPDHRTQRQQDTDVRSYYKAWRAAYLKPAGSAGDGTPMYRVSVGQSNPGRTVSEGQGYGMVIVALMGGFDANARRYFDGLWKFARAHPSAIDARLMAWQVPEQGDADSAFDGDVDIAYSLLLADRQWGSAGAIDYRGDALVVASAILESTIGPTSRLPMLGDWVDPNGGRYNQWTLRTSDLMPDHFRAFRRASGNAEWTTVVARSQAIIARVQARYSRDTGLLPDFSVPLSSTDHRAQPAPPGFLEGANDGNYYYNAGRDPWHLGADALLNHDATSLAQTGRIAEWARNAANGKPLNIKPGYRLDGTAIPPGDYFSIFFAAPLGVAAMTVPTQQQWLNAVYDSVRDRHEGYYEDSVTLLCMLLMSGNYWDPTTR